MDEQVGGAGGVEEEVGGEGRDAFDRGGRQFGRVDEGDGVVLVQDPPQGVLTAGAEVAAVAVGEQGHAVGAELGQGPLGLLGGGGGVGHGQGGEPAEAARVEGGERGGEVVEAPGQSGGFAGVGEEGGAGGGDGQDRGLGAQQVHELQSRLGAPLGQGAAARFGDAGPGEGVPVEARDEVLVDIDPAG